MCVFACASATQHPNLVSVIACTKRQLQRCCSCYLRVCAPGLATVVRTALTVSAARHSCFGGVASQALLHRCWFTGLQVLDSRQLNEKGVRPQTTECSSTPTLIPKVEAATLHTSTHNVLVLVFRHACCHPPHCARQVAAVKPCGGHCILRNLTGPQTLQSRFSEFAAHCTLIHKCLTALLQAAAAHTCGGHCMALYTVWPLRVTSSVHAVRGAAAYACIAMAWPCCEALGRIHGFMRACRSWLRHVELVLFLFHLGCAVCSSR